MTTWVLMQLLLHKVEKKIRDLGIFPRGAASVGEEDSMVQTKNAFSGNSEILPLTLASL